MFRFRTLILALFASCGFIMLFVRLVDLQLLRGDELRRLGRNRIVRLVQVPPRRGRILDRSGRVVACDEPSFDIDLVPAAQMPGKRGAAEWVSNLPGFGMERLLRLARADGEALELERKLAVSSLAEACPLTAELARVLSPEPGEDEAGRRKRAAQTLVDAVLARCSRSGDKLEQPRPCFVNVGEAAYVAVRGALADPETGGLFLALQPKVGSRRVYPYKEVLGHVTGYVGRLSDREYEQLRGTVENGVWRKGEGAIADGSRVFFSVLDGEAVEDEDEGELPESVELSILRPRKITRRGEEFWHIGYFANETVGRGGVEQYYNQSLRGRHARRVLRLERPDPAGPRRWEVLRTRGEARDGADLVLTIDAEIQRRVREIMASGIEFLDRDQPRPGGVPRQGVAVVMNPYNGNIYAMVSLPGYDPNTIYEDWNKLISDPRTPLFNLAVQGQFPPGSSLKPLVATAALHEGAITAATTFCCEGWINLGSHRYVCMNLAHHGDIDVEDALMVSCNIFFYKTGEALGAPRLYQWLWNLGLGHYTGVDISGERPGNLPARARTGAGWSLGETYHMSIGQGEVDATPLQIAVATAAIVNGGKIVQPHVALDRELEQPVREIAVDQAKLDIVRHGMWKVVQGDYGPGRRGTATRSLSGDLRGYIEGFEYGGKTGSAEHKKGRPAHAWFACFAPYEKPEIVCVVMIPEGGHGGSVCSPIARKIIMDFFDLKDTAGERRSGGSGDDEEGGEGEETEEGGGLG